MPMSAKEEEEKKVYGHSSRKREYNQCLTIKKKEGCKGRCISQSHEERLPSLVAASIDSAHLPAVGREHSDPTQGFRHLGHVL